MCPVHTASVVGPVCELSCPRAQEVTYTNWNGVWISGGFDTFCLAFGWGMSSLPLDEMVFPSGCPHHVLLYGITGHVRAYKWSVS